MEVAEIIGERLGKEIHLPFRDVGCNPVIRAIIGREKTLVHNSIVLLVVINPFAFAVFFTILAPAFGFLAGAYVIDFESVGVNPVFHLDIGASALFASDNHSHSVMKLVLSKFL